MASTNASPTNALRPTHLRLRLMLRKLGPKLRRMLFDFLSHNKSCRFLSGSLIDCPTVSTHLYCCALQADLNSWISWARVTANSLSCVAITSLNHAGQTFGTTSIGLAKSKRDIGRWLSAGVFSTFWLISKTNLCLGQLPRPLGALLAASEPCRHFLHIHLAHWSLWTKPQVAFISAHRIGSDRNSAQLKTSNPKTKGLSSIQSNATQLNGKQQCNLHCFPSLKSNKAWGFFQFDSRIWIQWHTKSLNSR